MGRESPFQIEELRSLHSSLRLNFSLMLVLTVFLLGYMGVRIFVIQEGLKWLDFGTICFFAIAAFLLCMAQMQCLKRMRHETREKIEKLTFIDELTGAYNYRYLDQHLSEELRRAKRHGYPVSVIYFDFDKFKAVNDNFGHDVGNVVLQRVADVARQSARGEDFVGRLRQGEPLLGRLGGDEFLMVLPYADKTGAVGAAERIKQNLDAIEITTDSGQRIDFVTYSLGIASFPEDADTQDALLRAADTAMYRAKKAGGDRVST